MMMKRMQNLCSTFKKILQIHFQLIFEEENIFQKLISLGFLIFIISLNKSNYDSNTFEYNPQRNTDVKVIYEFISDKTGCVGIQVIQNSMFILRNFPGTNKEKGKIDLKIVSFNEGDYHEIKEKVEEILNQKPNLEELISKSVSQVK